MCVGRPPAKPQGNRCAPRTRTAAHNQRIIDNVIRFSCNNYQTKRNAVPSRTCHRHRHVTHNTFHFAVSLRASDSRQECQITVFMFANNCVSFVCAPAFECNNHTARRRTPADHCNAGNIAYFMRNACDVLLVYVVTAKFLHVLPFNLTGTARARARAIG